MLHDSVLQQQHKWLSPLAAMHVTRRVAVPVVLVEGRTAVMEDTLAGALTKLVESSILHANSHSVL